MPTTLLGPRQLSALFAVALALGGPQAAAAGPRDPCGGRRITRIEIDNGDVFSPSPGDPGLLRWTYGLANALHVRTTRSFVRRELLFKEGDCLDSFLISESQRLLDNHGFLRDVSITSEDDGTDGSVVYVRTHDEWSTQVDVGVTYDAGPNLEKLQFTETNFLGNGVQTELTRRHRREDQSRSLVVFTPRLFGRTNGFVHFSDSPGGQSFGEHLAYPFVGEANRTSLAESYSRSKGFFSFAAGADQGYSHVLVPLLHESIEVAAARRFGDPGRAFILGLSMRRELTRLEGDPEYVLGSDFDASAPGPSELPDAVLRQLGSRGATRVAVHFGTRRYRYVQYEGLDAVRDVQATGIGYFAGMSVGKSLPVLAYRRVPDAGDAYARVHASYGIAAGSSLLHGGVTVEAGRADGAWRDVLAGAEFVAYGRARWLPSQTLFFRASGTGGWRTTVPFQLTLGGRDGVRSLLDDAAPGGRRLLLVVEDRVRLDWPDWGGADIGLTLFADAGRVWAGDVPFGGDSPWQGSAGIGLRLGFPRGTRNIWRPDLVFPVGPGNRAPIFRITYEINRIRNGFTLGKMDRSRRFNRGPESF